ncbi:hypothetical protein BAUCODRAFT_48128, partial [Baudoinia panamericana UAMH 10762]
QITATSLQATTYLLGVALFSITFLVFLNSSISFVITDVIGQDKHEGDAVGTLGFADELLALVACPLWGLLSDRIGVRTVAVIGYCIVGISLICLVQSTNVYPELLLGRLGFSLGGAATATMVTACLPAMVAKRIPPKAEDGRNGSIGHATSPSVSSELTITQNRWTSDSSGRTQNADSENEDGQARDDSTTTIAGTSQLAGFVGFFTGAGALLALVAFLPLPAHFQNEGQTRAQSVQTTFYIVGAVAFCVAIFIYFGLRHLPGEEDKSFSALWRTPYEEDTKTDAQGHLHTTLTPAPSYLRLVTEAVKLGFTDPAIGLGYMGGFVARASSVAISLFIPVFVNAYFKRSGLCNSDPHDITDIKEHCKRAYTLASALAGVAETAALICAPLFGWLGGKVIKGRNEWPLMGAAAIGIGGYIAFGFLRNPDAFHGDGGQWAFLAVIMIGISQIGAIVCSLGLLSRGVNKETESAPAKSADQKRPPTAGTLRPGDVGAVNGEETAPLLPRATTKETQRLDRSNLKGSIAGVYSFAGGAGILLLTKLGGALFDSWTPGAPFFLLAIFNGILLVAVALVGGGSAIWRRRAGV